MMKVMVIGHTYVVSENRGKLRHLARNANIDLQVVCPDIWNEKDFGEKVCAPEKDFTLYPLSIKSSGEVRVHRYDLAALTRRVAEFRPDLLHLEAESDSLVAAQLAAMKLRYRYAFTLFVWENLPSRSFRHCAVSALVRQAVDGLIAGSSAARDVAAAHGCKAPKIVLPQIGVDPDLYESAAPIDPWKDGNGLRVGFVGRLDHKKGLDTLIRAVAKTPGCLLTLVGQGEDEEGFKALTRELEISGRAIFTGGVEHGRVPGYLCGMDLLVLPSISVKGWEEQFGHVLIEAMAAGLPVIGSDSGVIPETVGDAGCIFPQGDADALAEILARWQAAPQEMADFAAAGKRRVRELFTDEAIAGKTARFWAEVMAKR